MIENFIQSDKLCMTIGYPTPLGWILLVILVILSAIGFVKSR